ncbi:MAG: hypothetical protein CM15mP6_4680 [Methanobacteriota archaeon]|nr:MAG: hypothetical protein CM15mP6_4680 [Euryarchaeota archaeon]
MRGRLVAISVLIALVTVSSSVQAQEETEEDNVIIDVVLPLHSRSSCSHLVWD